jgi:hypothetical protein
MGSRILEEEVEGTEELHPELEAAAGSEFQRLLDRLKKDLIEQSTRPKSLISPFPLGPEPGASSQAAASPEPSFEPDRPQ